MAKYRLLTKEELITFEKEFINYLVVNGITGEDWAVLKKDDPEKAEDITDLFSDVVFEKIMRNAQFLTYRSPKKLYAFQCLADELVLVGVDATIESTVNFVKTIPTDFSEVKVFTQTKKYLKPRELEIFEMTENGCQIDDGELFKSLCLAL